MKRLHERIKTKGNEYSERAINVVAFGDSITMGAFEEGVFDFQAVYHCRLKKILERFYPKTVFNMINSGVAGESSTDALDRVVRDVVDYKPDLTLVAFGMNDSNAGEEGLGLFGSSIEAMLEQIQNETESDVILLTPSFKPYADNPNVSESHKPLVDGFVRDQSSGVLKLYADAIIDIASAKKKMVADVYGVWESLRSKGVDTDSLLANGLNHPVRQMHQIAADLVAQLIIPEYQPAKVEDIISVLK